MSHHTLDPSETPAKTTLEQRSVPEPQLFIRHLRKGVGVSLTLSNGVFEACGSSDISSIIARLYRRDAPTTDAIASCANGANSSISTPPQNSLATLHIHIGMKGDHLRKIVCAPRIGHDRVEKIAKPAIMPLTRFPIKCHNGALSPRMLCTAVIVGAFYRIHEALSVEYNATGTRWRRRRMHI